ncbi:MAG: winged helix-turn-helix transcriptional regulator [Halobacteria archaeon]|nr:winged helix-turn-helix transcriptional regulator [Halobacteria archaeon]
MDYSIDNLDEKILYRLQENARKTSAPDIADEMNVSASTVRKRIDRLEEKGIIKGYHADVDYELCEGRLTNLLLCTTPAHERDRLAQQALRIPGVVNVREVMTGNRNIRIKAVGSNTNDLTRISRKLTNLGINIEDEDLMYQEYFHPYHYFGDDEDHDKGSLNISRDDLFHITVSEDAPIVGKTLHDANQEGLIPEDMLIVSIERLDKVITPKGDTAIQQGDLIKAVSSEGVSEETLSMFEADE